MNFKNWLKEHAWGSQGSLVVKQDPSLLIGLQASRNGAGAVKTYTANGDDLPPTKASNERIRKLKKEPKFAEF